jgi:hypothetical protein
MSKWTPIEKVVTTFVSAVALLMFFFPLLVIQAPLVDEQDVSGYDIFSKVRQFSNQVDKSSEPKAHDASSRVEHAPDTRVGHAPDSEPPLPLSLRIAWLIPVNVIAAFVLAAITILGAAIGRRISAVAATLGAILSIFSILHVLVANSDLHSWMQASMKTSTAELKGNPFAAMAEQFGSLMLNAFKIKPGLGLYVLGVSLAGAALIAKSGILTKFRVVRV